MMAGRLQLEVFETEAKANDTLVVDAAHLDEMKLEAFEQGYKAGWDDAAAAHAEDQGRIGADLARSLQSLSFTYQEARSSVLRALSPLIAEIAAKLLPALAAGSLAPMVAERLAPLAGDAADVPVRIYVNPAARAAVSNQLSLHTALPFDLIDEPGLGEGQAALRFGMHEEKIDLDGTVAAIRAALAAYFNPDGEERPDG